MPGPDTNRGAKRAREARERLGLGAGGPVGCVLTLVEERAGVPVVVATLPDRIAGACWRAGGRTVLWVNGAQALVRRRFTLAHELGHVCCGHEAPAVDTPHTLSAAARDPQEVQANAFAAELLAPRAGVEAELAGGEPALDDVVRIAARFGISAPAALNRCRTLGLVRPARAARLEREIEEGLAGYLAPPPLDDALARIRDLPRLSPALQGSALAAVLRGEASVDAAARAAGCAADVLADAAAAMSA